MRDLLNNPSPSISMIHRYGPRRHHQLIWNHRTAHPMVSSAIRVESLLASPVAHTQTFSEKSIASAHVTSPFSAAESGIPTLGQALISEKARSAIFIRKVRPDHIIEHVVLDRCQYRRQGSHRFWPTSRLQDRRVDRQACDVVQMRMCNEDRTDDLSEYVRCVRFCCLVWQLQTLERALFQHALVIPRVWNMPIQLPDDTGKECACINGDY